MQALSVRSEPIEEIGSDVDMWTAGAGVVDGYGFRPVNRGGAASARSSVSRARENRTHGLKGFVENGLAI
jgi:hypothetical protein